MVAWWHGQHSMPFIVFGSESRHLQCLQCDLHGMNVQFNPSGSLRDPRDSAGDQFQFLPRLLVPAALPASVTACPCCPRLLSEWIELVVSLNSAAKRVLFNGRKDRFPIFVIDVQVWAMAENSHTQAMMECREPFKGLKCQEGTIEASLKFKEAAEKFPVKVRTVKTENSGSSNAQVKSEHTPKLELDPPSDEEGIEGEELAVSDGSEGDTVRLSPTKSADNSRLPPSTANSTDRDLPSKQTRKPSFSVRGAARVISHSARWAAD